MDSSLPARRFTRGDSNKLVSIEDVMANEMASVDDSFVRLLHKFGVREESHISRLLHDLEAPEKMAYLAFCVDVYEGNVKFTNNDESMLRTLDNDHTVDCIRILALSHRIQHADHEWLESFVRCGGVSVLVETVDNCLSMTPKNVHALLKVIQCIRTVISKHSLEVVTSTRGAIHACVMSLDFKFGPLAVDVLELLNTFCGVSETVDAAAEVYSALQLLSKKVDAAATDRPFSFLVRAVQSDNASIRFSALQFINRLMMQLQGDMNEAIHFRLALTKAGLPEAINAHRSAVDAHTDAPMEEFTEPAISKDKCVKYDSCIDMKADTSAASGSRFEGMDDVLQYTVELDGDNLSFWIEHADNDDEEFQEQTADNATSRAVGSSREGAPDFVVPVSSIRNIVEYSGDAELQANYDQIFRVDMSDGTKLNFPFGASTANQERWVEWISALQHAVLKKKLELAVWPPQSVFASSTRSVATPGLPVFDQASLWKKQVELNDLLLNKEKINMNNLKGKRLFQYAYYVLDYNMCAILQKPEDKQAEMIARSIEILTQLTRVSLATATPASSAAVDDGELRKAKAEAASACAKISALEREVEHLTESLKMATAAAAAATASAASPAVAASQALSSELALKDNRIEFLEEETKRLLDKLQAATAAAASNAAALAAATAASAAATPTQAATPGVEDFGNDLAHRLKVSEGADAPPKPASKPAAAAGFGALFAQIQQKRAPGADNEAGSTADASSSVAPAATAVADDEDGAPLSELSTDMQEKYNSCLRMAKNRVPAGAIRIKMEGFQFPAKYIDKLFRQANLGDAGVSSAAAAVDPNAGAGAAKLFVARKQHTADPTRQRLNVPVKKVVAMDAAKSSLWRNIEEQDLNWGDLDTDFSTVVEPPAAAAAAEAPAVEASDKKAKAVVIIPPASDDASTSSPAGKGGMFAQLQQAAKQRASLGGAGGKTKPFTASKITPRYGTIIDDIKQYKWAPADALRKLIKDLDTDKLKVEACLVLQRSFPTEEELETLATCTEEDLKDNPVAEFFTTLNKIPRCKERIQFHVAVCKLSEKLESLAADMGAAIRNVHNGVKLLQDCRPQIASFFSMVLSICNYLNVKQANAAAFAITLESMTRLGTVRSKVAGRQDYTVLHAVDEQMKKSKKQLFWQDGEWDIGTLSLAAAGSNSVSSYLFCSLMVCSYMKLTCSWQS